MCTLVSQGLSKDFGAAGVRVGCVYTENEEVLGAVRVQTRFMTTSSNTLFSIAGAFGNMDAMRAFVVENQAHLGGKANKVKKILRDEQIPFLDTPAGLFIYLDLSEMLDELSWEAELRLTKDLIDAGVFMTPGKECCNEHPGHYRCCFASVDDATLVSS